MEDRVEGATAATTAASGSVAGLAVGADDVTSPEVGGGRRRLVTAPGERGVLEDHREGAHFNACSAGVAFWARKTKGASLLAGGRKPTVLRTPLSGP
jgi:hypothetical protein